METILRLLTDPISNRIIQQLRVSGKLTIAEIAALNPKLSRATIYRRMEKLHAANAVQIVDSRKVRGQTEQIYAIGEIWLHTDRNQEDAHRLVTMSLLQIMEQYNQHFESGNVDLCVIDAFPGMDIEEIKEKAEKILGWTAKYGIDEMCEDTWRWQKNNPKGYEE